MAEIREKDISHLAALAHLELSAEEMQTYTADLGRILDHFKELSAVSTDSVQPMTGGTFLKNIFRDETANNNENYRDVRDRIVNEFPEQDDGSLKVPAVFT